MSSVKCWGSGNDRYQYRKSHFELVKVRSAAIQITFLACALIANHLMKDFLKVAKMRQEKTRWKDFIETLSFLQWELSFLFLGLSCMTLTVCLMFTSLWSFPTLYFIWLVFDWHTPERGGRRTAVVRNWTVWKHYRDYFPIKLVKTAELNPKKNYILGSHPHGIMCVGAFSCFSTESCGFTEAFPGIRSSLVTLAGLFKIPLFRDYLMSIGCYPVSRNSLEYLLSKSGKGNAVTIVIGGAAEALASFPGNNAAVVKHRKGFVRLALAYGADLVPVYSFGENELFRQVVLSEGGIGRRFQDLFKKMMGFAPCLFLGDRFGFLPYRVPVTVIVGCPISVPKCASPSEKEVNHYHRLYIEGLSKLFNDHKTKYGLKNSDKLRII